MGRERPVLLFMAKVQKKICLTDLGESSNFNFLVNNHGAIALLTDKKGKVKPVGVMEINEFANAISIEKPYKSDLLPPNVLQVHAFEKNKMSSILYVFQYRPQKRTINLRYEGFKDKYTLTFPYVQMYVVVKSYDGKWIVDNSKCAATISASSIKSEADMVYHMPLNNVNDHGFICWGRSPIKIDNASSGLSAVAAVANFWGSVFNDHYPYVADYAPPEIKNYDIWEKFSNQEDSINKVVTLKYKPMMSYVDYCKTIVGLI